jgi:hypothetical protein
MELTDKEIKIAEAGKLIQDDSLSGVISSYSSGEMLKRIGWEAEKIFASYPDHNSRSKTRQDCRVLVAQAIVDDLIEWIPKKNRKDFIRNLGYYTEAECARHMGCSRQYVNKISRVMTEKIFYANRWWLRPIPISKRQSSN